MKQGIIQADEPMNIQSAEITDYLQSLLNPDILLLKKDNWSPPIRPMHRIFEYKDINSLRGFSGSWVVSTWYDGKRVVIIRKDDDITYFDEQGKKMGIPKSIKESVEKINDKSYTIDGILAKDGLYIIDIMNYDDSNIADMNTNERLRILRGQFESHDNVFIPGPYNTKITDDEGLKGVLSGFDEDKILIRDAKSTYMRGETRHPKWLLMRKERTLNFIILDRRGKGPYTYQLGAGPIVSEEGLGNRAVDKDGKIFMDVATIRNIQKPFEEGAIIEAKISGVSKRNRAGRQIYDAQISSILGEGEGEGIASAESLDLFTKSYAPILSPHTIEIDDLILITYIIRLRNGIIDGI